MPGGHSNRVRLLLPLSKPPREPDKSPGPPKLAIKIYLARVISLVRPPSLVTFPINFVGPGFRFPDLWSRF